LKDLKYLRRKYVFTNKHLTAILMLNLDPLKKIYGYFRHLEKENLDPENFQS